MTIEERKRQDTQDIWAVLQSREGARVFSWILELCGVERPSFHETSAYLTAMREGERNVGIAVLNWLRDADENADAKLLAAKRERKVG